MNTPAKIGTIQWIEAVNAVQPNLVIPIRLLFSGEMEVAHQKRPTVNIGAPTVAGSRRHSGIGTLSFAANFLA